MSEVQKAIGQKNYRVRLTDGTYEDVEAAGFELEDGRVSFRGHDDAELAAFETASISYIADESVVTSGPVGVSG